jgi:hypothetical protein
MTLVENKLPNVIICGPRIDSTWAMTVTIIDDLLPLPMDEKKAPTKNGGSRSPARHSRTRALSDYDYQQCVLPHLE